MGIIAWVILGLVAGFIASKIVHHHGQGLVVDLILGVVGAFVGGFVVRLIGGRGVTCFNVWSLLVAIGGAVVLLFLWNLLSRHWHHGDTVAAR
jgi:uncharacterized membrane protein YeaQ/YmgE (transglycosylase-associated protein family)